MDEIEIEEATARLAEAKQREWDARKVKCDAEAAYEAARDAWLTKEALVVDAWQSLQNAIDQATEVKP